MHTIIRETKENIGDLQMALYLECTHEEAKKIGTDRYWRSIHRKVKKIERKTKKLEKAINKGASGITVWDNIKYYLLMSIPFAFLLVRLLFGAGVIALLVLLFIKLLG